MAARVGKKTKAAAPARKGGKGAKGGKGGERPSARELASTLASKLAGAGGASGTLRLATAESCTGGLIASTITDVPGSSKYFLGSVVAYDDTVKKNILRVRASTLSEYGAVSAETAVEMAEGVLTRTRADVAVAVTGIAGPGGGTPDKPVGTVFICVAGKDGALIRGCSFTGTRRSIKTQTVESALEALVEFLAGRKR